MITADLLKRIPLFAGIPDDERASLGGRPRIEQDKRTAGLANGPDRDGQRS